jgi:hypothetical protein
VPHLAIAKDFLTTYAALDKKLRKAVDEALDKFADTYFSGGHLEKITDSRDPRWRTLRINQGYRGVVLAPDSGDVFLLVTVLAHAEAYRYIRNRRPSVNQALGVLEFRDETALDTMSTALAPVAAASPDTLFREVPDKHFAQLGIDESTIRIARLLPDESHLDALAIMMPKAQHDALTALASGMSPDEVWALLSREQAARTGTLGPVLWHGSLNLFASTGPTDLMMRLTDPGACDRVRRIVDAAQQDQSLRPRTPWQPSAEAGEAPYGPVPEVGKVVNNRLYINVPKAEKEIAKREVRARWNPQAKLWWVDPGTSREKLARWL